MTYPTAEHKIHAMQCALANDLDGCSRVQQDQRSFKAKRIADALPESADWRLTRENVMEKTISKKFDQNPDLADQLISTGSRSLNEATVNMFFRIGESCEGKWGGKLRKNCARAGFEPTLLPFGASILSFKIYACLFELYLLVLAKTKVTSGWAPNCDSVHSYFCILDFSNVAPLEDQAASTMTHYATQAH